MSEQFFSGLAAELVAKLRRVSAFVDHGPSVGSYHEAALRSVLKSMLPNRFSVRTGFAYDQKLGCSQQGDILIVDENHPLAYHFREDDFAIVLPEALVCVIEVKTRLTKATFKESMTSLYSFTKVSTSATPITFLFAYEATPLTDKTLMSWYDAIDTVPDEIRNYPWSILALNQGLITLRVASPTSYGHCTLSANEKVGPKMISLSLFLQTVRKALLVYARMNNNPFEHAVQSSFEYGKYGYRFPAGAKGSA